MGRLEDLAKAVAERSCPPPDGDPIEEECPFLWEFLSTDKWGDGSERIMPRIVIERIPGAYRVTLQDDALCIKKSAIARVSTECFRALEAVLVDPEAPFESFKSYRNRKGPKVPEAKKGGGHKKR